MSGKVHPVDTRPSMVRSKSVSGHDDQFKLDLFARQAERKKLAEERKSFFVEFGLDAVDVIVKAAVFINFVVNHNKTCEEAKADLDFNADGECNATDQYFVWILVLLALAFVLTTAFSFKRVGNMKDMQHVADKGYSLRWKVKERVRGGEGGKDPRIQRDADRRLQQHFKMRSFQAFVADLPWIFFNTYRISQGNAEVIDLASVCVAGFGFGMKFQAFVSWVKFMLFVNNARDKKDVYQILPADVKCGSAASNLDDTVAAVTEAYTTAAAQIASKPTFIWICMTATHDHEAGLAKLRELAPDVPYTGCTTCQGVLIGNRSERSNHKVVGVWVMCDPDGGAECHNFDLGETPEEQFENSKKAGEEVLARWRKNRDRSNPVLSGQPSFVWVHSAPGPEDQVMLGLSDVFGSEVPIVGGSSADNDITGKWKQWTWSSTDGGKLSSGGCSIAMVYCSAIVQGQLFTGYNATGKSGTVTKCDGPRHIMEIEGRPAMQVYNEWTGGEYNEQMKEAEDSVILGPSSLYPLGQVCGEDADGEPFLRSMHPHLIKKATNSLTLFSDVKVGEAVVLMSGTKDNIVNRIAGVSTHIVRESGFTLQEVRGALLIFCAGCMMFASDRMDEAAGKVAEALGGTPYMGAHTFGEQGQFPDGMNRHGNLMFSCLIISSRRRVVKLLNVDTGKHVLETEAAFKDIVSSGAVA